jgi:hypothetical protein
MGGPGSGNRHHWWRSGKKTVVERCRVLDANRWMRDGILKGGVRQTGSCCWYRDGAQKEQNASIGFEVRVGDDGVGRAVAALLQRERYSVTPPSDLLATTGRDPVPSAARTT